MTTLEDLYYAVFSFIIPPMRNRRDFFFLTKLKHFKNKSKTLTRYNLLVR